MNISYAVDDPDGDLLTISVTVLDKDGFAVPAQSLVGDIGSGIQRGSNKLIVWDYSADMVDICDGMYQVRVIADDSSAGTPSAFAPVGEFLMGDAIGDGRPDEIPPPHPVYIDAFYMDKYEVTNAQYSGFLNQYGKNVDSVGHELL